MGDANSKRVRITIDVDQHFVRMLKANVGLKQLHDAPRQLTPGEVLSLIAVLEMQGAPDAQTHIATPIEWRNHIDVVPGERRYSEDNGATWHATGAKS